jgi:hypothetical protein
MKKLFSTIDNNGNLVKTEGTYVIGRSVKDQLVAIFSNIYKDGVAENTGVFTNGDIILVYPKGYVGISTKNIGTILLKENAIDNALQAKAEAINSRLTSLQTQ